MAILQAKERGLRKKQTCQQLALRFLASKTVRNTFLLRNPPICHILLWQPSRQVVFGVRVFTSVLGGTVRGKGEVGRETELET